MTETQEVIGADYIKFLMYQEAEDRVMEGDSPATIPFSLLSVKGMHRRMYTCHTSMRHHLIKPLN